MARKMRPVPRPIAVSVLRNRSACRPVLTPLRFPFREIVVRRAHTRALTHSEWRVVGMVLRVDPAIRTHLDHARTRIILEHPVLTAKLLKNSVDGGLGAKWLAAGNARERLFPP